jgi:hypothetical protein
MVERSTSVSSNGWPSRSAKITPSQRPAAATGVQVTLTTPGRFEYRAGTSLARSVVSTTRSSASARWAIGVSSSVP